MTPRMRPRVVQLQSGLRSSFQPAAVDLHDDGITEAEARKRLSSYVTIRIDKSLPAIDGQGNLVASTWDKASHMMQRDMSQQEARQKVRELSREIGCVSDKTNELSTALQRQLERAHTRLENMESDRRYVYALAQLDWKFKRVEAPREYHVSKDKKRDKERHRARSEKERVSVTAYFKREPSSGENCLKLYKRQQRQDISASPTSRSSATSFSSSPSKDSNGNLTPRSSVDDTSPHRHYEERRGRSTSRYHQSRDGEPLEIAVRSRRDSVGRHDCIVPPVPDPTRPEPKPAMDSRRMEQRVCGEGMARSKSARDSSRQVRFAQSLPEEQRDSFNHVLSYSRSGQDVKQGSRLGRASLADKPRDGCREPVSGPAIRHTYREHSRQYHRGKGVRASEPSGTVWRKQDAQRYMNDRRRLDQDAWI